ncbi:MAG: ABC transporter permease [Spirochaetota bacterium]
MKLSTIALRNVGRNKRRSVLSGIAIGVAAMAIVILFSLINGMQADLANNLQDFYSGMIRVRHAEYDQNEILSPLHLRVQDAGERAAELESMDGVTAISPRINFPASIYQDGETSNAQGIGVDMSREVQYSRLNDYLVEGAMPGDNTRGMLLGTTLADRLGVSVGDTLTILTTTMTRGSNAITFTVAGTLQFPVQGLNAQALMIPLPAARDLVKMDDAVTEILIKLEDESQAAAVAREIESRWDSHDLRIATWREIPTSYSFIEFARNIYNGMAAFFFLLGSTVIITTTMIVIFERMREIGTIAAMGMTGSEIVRLFFLESFFIALIAAGIGVVAGTGISLVLGEVGIDMREAVQGMDIEFGGQVYPRWRLGTTVFVYIYSIAVTGLAAFFPTRRAAKIEPVEALHTV